MKKIFILLFILSSSYAATVTPNGKIVALVTGDSLSVILINTVDSIIANIYPDVINIEAAQADHGLYNCHFYAWHNNQGYDISIFDDAWLYGKPTELGGVDTNSLKGYYNDTSYSVPNGYASYVEATNSDGEICVYRDSNGRITHSARTLSNSTKVISKWGRWGIYKHEPDDCTQLRYYWDIESQRNIPYCGYGSISKYYKINPYYLAVNDPGGRHDCIDDAIDDASSGCLVSVYPENYTINQDITVPHGVTLYIQSGVELNLSNANISTSLGTIEFEDEDDIASYICRKNGSAIKGLYPTLSSAINASGSGDSIKINIATTLGNNVTIPSGVIVKVYDEGEINLGTYTITGDVEVDPQGKLNPHICVEKTSTDKYFPSTSSATSYISDPSDKLVLDGEYTLTQDLTVQEYNLEIGSKSNIDMDGNNIVIDWVEMGSLSSLSSSAKFSPNLRLLSGTTILGFYGSLSDAYSDGSVVEMRDTLISSSDLSVPSGKTLKIKDNSVMKLPSGYNLDVYGTLNADNSTFTSTSTSWGGIEFKSGSGGTVNACYFANASLAMNINYASPTIHDALIEDCGYGIRIYGNTSNPNIYDNIIGNCNYGFYVRSTDANIHDNTINDCSIYGLYLYNTSPDIEDNEIENSRVYLNSCYSTFTNNYIHGSTSSGYAMYIYNSDPYFYNNTITAEDDFTIETSNSYVCFGLDGQQGPPDCYGLNVLDNDEGNDGVIYARNGSEVILGYGPTGLYDCGHNSIYNRNYPLWTDASSIIWAWDCYWGDDDAPDCIGNVEIGDVLDEDFEGVGSTLAKSTQSSGQVVEFVSVEDSLYHYARELIVESNYSLALAVLEEIITDYQESNYAYRALNLSVRLCDKFEVASTEEWLAALSNEVSNDDLSEIIDLKRVSNYQKNKKINEAIALSESNSVKSNNKHEVSTLFNLFNFYHKDKGDIDEAEKYFEKLKEKYPNHELTLIACSDMNEDSYNESLAKTLTSDDNLVEEVVIPETFKVHAAFPNPFNPSTTIEFELPVKSDVKCCIYNVKGYLVKEYSYNQNAGTHRIIWNGANIPSGIYLIRFVAEASNGSETFVDYQKVTLLK